MPIHKNTVMMVLREQQLNYSHSKTNKHNKYEGESIYILLEEITSTWSYIFKLNSCGHAYLQSTLRAKYGEAVVFLETTTKHDIRI